MLDEGASYSDIKEKLDTTAPTISLWKRRYREGGVVGLASVHPGQPPKKLTPQLRAKILAKTQQAPPDGSTHWSLRKTAGEMGVSKDLNPAGMAGSRSEAASAGPPYGQQ